MTLHHMRRAPSGSHAGTYKFLPIALFGLLLTHATRAEQLPLWEAGAGLAVVSFPDYRGSDERNLYALPIPYVVYRGERLKIDRQKVRGLLFSSDTAELDVSVSGTVPVRSRDNAARQGMPNLDPTLEIGPSVNVRLFRSASDRTRVELRLPLRAVIATDIKDTRYAGVLFHPHVNVDFKDVFPGPGWNLGLLAGPVFATERYHDYFYGVAPQFATPSRPAFNARGGYSGLQFIGALSKRFQNYWVGGFVKADSLHGAAFEDSPLVKQKYALSAGVAVAWIFGKSREFVEAKDAP
jgi:MipA family protein